MSSVRLSGLQYTASIVFAGRAGRARSSNLGAAFVREVDADRAREAILARQLRGAVADEVEARGHAATRSAIPNGATRSDRRGRARRAR